MTDAELEILRRSAVMSATMPSTVVVELIDEIRRLRRDQRTSTGHD